MSKDQQEIYQRLTEVVRTLFDEYEGPVGPSLNAKQVEQWDSLANVQFMVLVEQAFKIRFTTDEITGLPDLGALVEVIEKEAAQLMTLAVGDKVEHAFVIDQAAMQTFSALSGDKSSIHVDDEFARSRGFERAIVYGGLMLAQLSFVLGSRIPGDHGVSTRWNIDYRRALYVGEAAVLRLEITDISPATGIIETKFSIRAGERVIATGKTQSLVPAEELTPP